MARRVSSFLIKQSYIRFIGDGVHLGADYFPLGAITYRVLRGRRIRIEGCRDLSTRRPHIYGSLDRSFGHSAYTSSMYFLNFTFPEAFPKGYWVPFSVAGSEVCHRGGLPHSRPTDRVDKGFDMLSPNDLALEMREPTTHLHNWNSRTGQL